jgi:membrane protein required for colicin V production
MPQLIWVDYCIIAIIGFSALAGMVRGLIREVLALVAWGAAIWIGLRFAREASVLLNPVIPIPSARMAAAFGILFLASLMVTGLVGFLLSKWAQATGLSGMDRFAGLAFGLARGMLIVAALVLAGGMTPLPEDPWWKASNLIPPFQSLAQWLRDRIPADYGDYLKFSVNSTR